MIKRIAIYLLAVLAGYIVMVLLITVVQELIFGGVSYQTTPMPQLLIVGVLTAFSAVAGGAVAAKIFGNPWYTPALAMCGLIILETTYMTSAGKLDGPLWFDIAAASSLVVGILVGAYLVQFAGRLVVAKAPNS